MENITISNLSRRTATIDIEGIIGIDESLQFDQPEQRVATYEKLRAALEGIRSLKNPRVVVNIRSAGGDVNDALLIHDALRSLDARIITRCYGYIASAATIIAQAASPGRREISANALYLVHNSISRAEGNASAIERTIELLHQTDRRIAAIYAARSGRTEEEFAELMNRNGGNGRWLSPAEAMEMGLVDKVIGAEAVGNADARLVLGLGLPEPPELAQPDVTAGPGAGLWSRILEAIGFAVGAGWPEPQPEAVEADGPEAGSPQVDGGPEELTVQAPDVQAAPAPEVHAAADTSAAALAAKLAAKPTLTTPREDPSAADARPSANQSAYEQDALGLKK
ncbi:MAG: Clp protease ClpP [Rikenellaceae bacterium]|jgi:ATP-dependent protease ClpP protease subunit|nr:Clp protease ClpP [Rikenellaceae bacterium]